MGHFVLEFRKEIGGGVLFRKKNQARFGAELPASQREGSVKLRSDLSPAGGHGAGKNEYGIGAAHFAKEGDRLWPADRKSIKARPAAIEPVKPAALTSGC